VGIGDCCDGKAVGKPAGRVTIRSIRVITAIICLGCSEISVKVEKIPLFVPLKHNGQGTAKVRRQQKNPTLQTSKGKPILIQQKRGADTH